jgi:hypothetical protein
MAPRPAYALCAALAALLAACGPIPVEQAERQCLQQVQPRSPISGEVGIGVGSGGRVLSNVDLDISVGAQLGTQDPAAIYDRCVYNKSGQPPTRPLYSRTDWKG